MPSHRAPTRFSVILLALGVMGLSLLISAPARAQVAGATLSGTVTDPSGAVVPQAQISVRNVATGVSTTVASNADGFYNARNLLPGNYEATVTGPGFATEVQSGITLVVGGQQVLNFTLKVGQATEKIEVTAEAPTVELASSSISAVVSSNTVVELPLNGRSWTDLSELQPGTIGLTTQSTIASDPTGRADKGVGAQVSIDGARPPQNNYRLDGISVNDFTNGAPSNVTGGTSGVDAIAEFSVLTSNYSAEYGKTSGGVINAITRSGASQFHGSAYEFLRNSALDARNFFDPPTIPPFKRNQFGGSIGGPIRKDRTFFFANYEGLRQVQSVAAVNVVPSAAARAGQFCSQPSTPTACTPSTVTVSPPAQAYFPFYPLPNAGLTPTGNGDTGFFNIAEAQAASDNFFTTRIDHKFSEKDQISGTYEIDRGPFTLPDNFDGQITEVSSNRQVYAIEETHVFSANFVNSVRIGAFRQYETEGLLVSTNNPLLNNTSLNYLPGLTPAEVRISGISTFLGGAGGFGYRARGYTAFQAYDDASVVRGTHSIKFGFAAERQDYNEFAAPNPDIWTFGSLVNFATNRPSSFITGALPESLAGPERGVRDTVIGLYVQDDWRLRPNLTLNLGLRYEMLTNPTEVHGWEASLTSLAAPSPRLGNPFFLTNPTLHDFEPRVGFAWDPFHSGKTSVRGGFGMFDSLPMAYEFGVPLLSFYPYASTFSAINLPAGTFYNGVSPFLSPKTAFGQYLEQNPHRTYVMQWNLSVQRELAPNLTATVSYAGSVGRHLLFRTSDSDEVFPTLTSAGWLYPNPIGSGTRINPNFGQLQSVFYSSNSSYNALELLVSKRMSHGFQVETSFTWGRSIDNTSTTLATSDLSNAITNLDWYAPDISRGPSDFNVGRTLVVDGVWQIPGAKSLTGLAGRMVNGWQLGAIFKVADGVPFTPTFGKGGNVDGSNSASTWDYPDRLSGPGCNTLVNPGNPSDYVKTQCFSLPTAPSMAYWAANCDTTSNVYGTPRKTEPFPVCLNLRGNSGRNILNGPGLTNLDLSVFKNNYIGEKFNAQFRLEVFNLANHVNFTPPATTDLYNSAGVPSGTGGLLTSTATASREIQFALKLIW